MELLREGDMLLVFPEGTRNRDGKARPQLGAARLALEAGAALRARRDRGQRPHQAAAAALPEGSACTTASRSALDDLPADDLRRASHAATKRWSEAIEAGARELRAL